MTDHRDLPVNHLSPPYGRSNGDANFGRTVKSMLLIGAAVTGIFGAGLGIGRATSQDSATLAQDISALRESAEAIYVRKDGHELSDIKGQLGLLDQKIDLLLRERGLVGR